MSRWCLISCYGIAQMSMISEFIIQYHTFGSPLSLICFDVLPPENPWRCDCALGWLRTWIREDGQRLLSSAEQRRLMCSEPPRLSHLSLVEVAPNSLVCIPPVVQLEPSHLTVRLGESLRVSCQASGYPQPQVTWKKASHGKPQLSPRGLVQELGPNGELFRPGTGGVVTALPSSGRIKVEGAGGVQGLVRGAEEGGERDSFDPDMGSGMLYECL